MSLLLALDTRSLSLRGIRQGQYTCLRIVLWSTSHGQHLMMLLETTSSCRRSRTTLGQGNSTALTPLPLFSSSFLPPPSFLLFLPSSLPSSSTRGPGWGSDAVLGYVKAAGDIAFERYEVEKMSRAPNNSLDAELVSYTENSLEQPRMENTCCQGPTVSCKVQSSRTVPS